MKTNLHLKMRIMLDRRNIEKVLASYGIAPTAPDEEIRSVLVGASWRDDDVNSALYVLRENPTTHQSHLDALHSIQRSNGRLSPEAIKALLGVDVNITQSDVSRKKRRRRQRYGTAQIINVVITTIIFGVGSVFFMMWVLGVGIFHITVR